MFSDSKIVIFILIVIDFTITTAQYEYDSSSESDLSFEDFDLKNDDSTNQPHASLANLFYYKKEPGDDGPPLIRSSSLFHFHSSFFVLQILP